MNTPSHLIITAALHKKLNRAWLPRAALLWGAVAPDIPLFALWIGGTLYYRFVRDWSVAAAFRHMEALYFTDPFWIVSHNLLHSPTVLLLALAGLWRFRHQTGSLPAWCFWFASSCLLHTCIDIPTHGDDGPLLLFPFDWSIRFYSPISYWDPQYYGREFFSVELTLDLVLLGYLCLPGLIRAIQRRRGERCGN